MAKINYVKMNPTENKTILVETSVPRRYQAAVAGMLLKQDPDSEQVGFLEEPSASGVQLRLQMMGGEFCGNAAISAAAWLFSREGLSPNDPVVLEVSGTEDPVLCDVAEKGAGFVGTVGMPLPERVEECTFSFEGREYPVTVVCLPGITHIILGIASGDAAAAAISHPDVYRAFAERAIRPWAEGFPAEAVGLLLFDENTDEMRPLVYVKPTDSLYWERGCGTGSAAVGAALTVRRKMPQVISVRQPGGSITVRTEYSRNRIQTLSITGGVVPEAAGTIEIDFDEMEYK